MNNAVTIVESDIRKQFHDLLPADLEASIRLVAYLRRLDTLPATEVSPLSAQLAAECLNTANRIRMNIWKRDSVDVQKAYELHRSLTTKRAQRVAFLDRVIATAKAVSARFTMEQRRKQEAERLERERLAREDAERQKRAEIDARLAEAAQHEQTNPEMAEFIMQEAEDLDARPVVAVVVPAEPTPKVDGVNTRYEVVGEVKDLGAMLTWILGIGVDELATFALEMSHTENVDPAEAREYALGFLHGAMRRAKLDLHRELYPAHSVSGMKSMLRRNCTIHWNGDAPSVIGTPPGIMPGVKPIVSRRG